MSRRRLIFRAVRLRHVSQLAFLLLFLGLILLARPRPGVDPAPWLKAFFWFDPLILIATWLSAHAVPAAALASLLVIVLTIVLGRVFCGWICPLGTIHALAGRFLFWVWPDRKRREHWSRWQVAKYYVLAGFLAMAVFGGHWVCVLDPLVLLYRTTTTALLPGFQWAVEESSTAIFQADPGFGKVRLVKATDPAYEFLRDRLFVTPHQSFLGASLILAFFVGTLLLNRLRPRFWCRYVCPLGGLLGIFAWRPAVRRAVDHAACNQCDLCGMHCHGAAAAVPGDRWKPSECFGCMNCTDACGRESLSFTLAGPWRTEPEVEKVDLRKRSLLAAVIGGVTGLWLFRSSPLARGASFNPELIRPPGARNERDFLARCTACGLCMKVCPTGGLQPALTEAGLEGLWTPRLVARIGYCDYLCNRCGQICPTQAIQPLTLDDKHKTRIGLASFDVTRCIPYAYGRDCMVCEEHCPIPDKAIYFVEVEIQVRGGGRLSIKQPRVDPSKCTGCGICESVCPFKDRAGVRVTSANESRHEANQPILGGDSGEAPYGG